MGGFITNRGIKFIKNNILNVQGNNAKYLKENNFEHYLCTYDLLEHNFEDIYDSFSISYFFKHDKSINYKIFD